MKKTTLIVALILVITYLPIVLFAQLQEDGSVNIITYWKTNDQFSLKITTTSSDSTKENVTVAKSHFNSTIHVIEATEQGTKFDWTYSSVLLGRGERIVENLVFKKLINKKLKIQLSDVGQFSGILNYDVVKADVDKILNQLAIEYKNDYSITTQLNAYKEIITSKQGLETALLKHVKIYLFSFGYNFKPNHATTNKVKLPNPVGGAPLDAVETIALLNIDKEKAVCEIETNKTIDTELFKKSIIDLLKRTNPGNEAGIGLQLKDQSLTLSEKTLHYINYDLGLPYKAFFERITKLGFQNRIYRLEIETIR